MGSCTEELWPSFRISESDGVWKRDGTQEELGQEMDGRWFRKYVGSVEGFLGMFTYYLSGENSP